MSTDKISVRISGVNGIHVGKTPRMSYISAVAGLKRGFESCPGIDVEVSPVKLGETFEKYSVVVVFLASMRGFLCGNTLGTLWAIHQASNEGKLVISFDDWQVQGAIGGIRNAWREWDKLLETDPFGYAQLADLPPYRAEVTAALDALSNKQWPWKTLLPVYLGGDLSLFGIPTPPENVIPYNPSVVFKGEYGFNAPETFSAKKKEWVLAALHDHTKWLQKQGTTWPATQYGHRKSGQVRMPEAELFKKYSEATGIFSPFYRRINGAGWWRARWGLSADALSVIVGDPKELAMVDKSAYGVTATQVEAMSDKQLLELALAQREAYYEAAGTIESMIQQVSLALP
jgi:hypothetical protein